MNENLRLSSQGVPTWFSPKHAGEKFKEISLALADLAAKADRAKTKALASKLRDLKDTAEGHARHYSSRSPVQSVRIMHPSGAIFVILADGREVLVPQPGGVPRKLGPMGLSDALISTLSESLDQTASLSISGWQSVHTPMPIAHPIHDCRKVKL